MNYHCLVLLPQSDKELFPRNLTNPGSLFMNYHCLVLLPQSDKEPFRVFIYIYIYIYLHPYL